jgi:flagellar biosynthetic protein FliR
LSTSLLITMGLVASRMGGVLMLMPVFGARGVPKMAKALCLIALTIVISPSVPSAELVPSVGMLIVAIITEVMVGVLIGGVVAFIFGALSLANEVMSNQIGHGAAKLFDPMLKTSTGPVSTLGSLLASVVFLGTNLHLVLLVNVADSFYSVPPGGIASPIGAGVVWVQVGQQVIEAGIGLASPVLVLVFLIHCFVAIITRLAPSMNIFFSLGMVLTVAAGCWMFMLMLPYQLQAHFGMVSAAVERVPEILGYMDLVK